MKPSLTVKRMAAEFGLRAKRMHIIQDGVYRIITTKGQSYCLKRMPYPPARLRWIDRTLLRIKKKGFRRIVWRNPRRKWGKRLFVQSGPGPEAPAFVLHPWVKGRWPKAASTRHMKECGAFLAKFHTAGRKIRVSKTGRLTGIGTWPAYMREERRTLQNMIRKAGRNGFRSPLDRMLKKSGNTLTRMANASLRMLKKGGYRNICRTAKPTLCHGDMGPTNFIRSKKGMVALDFETLRLDLRSYDLYRIIYNSCQRNGWRFKTARAILDGYQSVSPLRRSDYAMLKAQLRFPRGIIKLIENYDRCRPHDKRTVERKFPLVLAHERKRKHFLKRLDAYAKSGR